MAKKKNKQERNKFTITLFNVYRPSGPNLDPGTPTFNYTEQNGEKKELNLLQPYEPEGSMQNALSQLQPLARKIFEEKNQEKSVFKTLNPKLADELINVAWKVEARKGSVTGIENLCSKKPGDTTKKGDKPTHYIHFKFTRAKGLFFENDIRILFVSVEPVFPPKTVVSAGDLSKFAGAMVNKLYYTATVKKSKKKNEIEIGEHINEQFQKERRQARKKELVQLKNSFADNAGIPLIDGLLGSQITIGDILNSMAGPGMESMLTDRFLSQSLLKTPEKVKLPVFNEDNYTSLVRLAKGQSDSYLTADSWSQSPFIVPVLTFSNVLFMATGEGLACHAKPGTGQDFLLTEFPARFANNYLLLFALTVYQRYRLADLAEELDRLVPSREGLVNEKLDEAPGKSPRKIRMLIAHHALRVMNTQPTFLTNYREVYEGLQQAFGIRDLAAKVEKSCKELDYLLDDQYRRARKKLDKQFNMAKVILAMAAEIFALPYYVHGLLSKAFHAGPWSSVVFTLLITFVVVKTTWTLIPAEYREAKQFNMAKVILVMAAEIFALPYCVHGLLSKAFHAGPWLSVVFTLLITILVVKTTWNLISAEYREAISARLKQWCSVGRKLPVLKSFSKIIWNGMIYLKNGLLKILKR